MRITSPPADSWRGSLPKNDRTAVVSGLTTLAILGVAFGAMALGTPSFWVVFPVGFGGVLPLVVAYSRRTERSTNGATTGMEGQERSASGEHHRDEALQTLRSRYARGELTGDAFERRLEQLLETESVTEASDWMQRRAVDSRGPDNERGQS